MMIAKDVCLKFGRTSMSHYIQDFSRMRSQTGTQLSIHGVQVSVMEVLSLTQFVPMQAHHKMKEEKRKNKDASLRDYEVCMQMEMKANLYDNNAKQCKEGNQLYKRK